MNKLFISQNVPLVIRKTNKIWMSYLGAYIGTTPARKDLSEITSALFHIHCTELPIGSNGKAFYISFEIKVTTTSGSVKTIQQTDMPVYLNGYSINDQFISDKLSNLDLFFVQDLGYTISNIKTVELVNWSARSGDWDKTYQYVIAQYPFYKDNVVRNLVWNVQMYSDYSNPGWSGTAKFYLNNSSDGSTLYSPTSYTSTSQDFNISVSYLNYTSSFSSQLRLCFDLYTNQWKESAGKLLVGKDFPVNTIVKSYNENGYLVESFNGKINTVIPDNNDWGYGEAGTYLDDTNYGSCVVIDMLGNWDYAG